jgi:hypothetical protein
MAEKSVFINIYNDEMLKHLLYIYEIDDKDRKNIRNIKILQNGVLKDKDNVQIDQYHNLSCYTNKLFIENYHHYHNKDCYNLEFKDGVIIKISGNTPIKKINEVCDYLPLKDISDNPTITMDTNQLNNYLNNIKFVKGLDILLDRKNFSESKEIIKQRSTHLFKGFKHFLIDNNLKVGEDDNGRIDTDKCKEISIYNAAIICDASGSCAGWG